MSLYFTYSVDAFNSGITLLAFVFGSQVCLGIRQLSHVSCWCGHIKLKQKLLKYYNVLVKN